jgi:SAM-dependent methyltransferase
LTASPYDHPELYDLAAPANLLADAFYLDEARRRRGAVLDLASGTGRFSIPLAQAGIEVVGGDISPAMLTQARRRAAEVPINIPFLQMDMRDFDLPDHRVGLIFIAANSILHLQQDSDFRRCFRAIARHLAPGGAFVFDAFVPSPHFLERDSQKRYLNGRFVHGRLGDVIWEETSTFDPATRLSHVTWYWSTATDRDFLSSSLQLRQIFPEEWPALLESGGLRLTSRFGGFDRSPFDVHSFQQVCICEAAE